MKRFSSLCLAALLFAAARTIFAGGLECAIDDALSSRNVFGTPVEAFDHQFTIKPVETSEIARPRHTVTGEIVRHVKAGKEDRITYRIVKEKGAIKEVALRINDGPWESLSPAMTGALGDHLKGTSMSNDEQNAAARAMYEVGKKSWRSAVEYLVARIGVRHC